MINSFKSAIMRSPGIVLLVALSALINGCNTLAKRNDGGVIVARRAQIRSSYEEGALAARAGARRGKH